MAALFSDEELKQKYRVTTVLATSHRVLNPIATIQEAMNIYRQEQAIVPPRNTTFRIIWFYPKENDFPLEFLLY